MDGAVVEELHLLQDHCQAALTPAPMVIMNHNHNDNDNDNDDGNDNDNDDGNDNDNDTDNDNDCNAFQLMMNMPYLKPPALSRARLDVKRAWFMYT